MVRFALLAAAALIALPLADARADFPRLGIFRKKKEESPAPEKEKAAKVKQLLETVKSDPDESKRLAAVEALTAYDPRTHVEIVPTLVNSVKLDPSAAVRAAAAQSIGELKPPTQTAGVALEQTLANDPVESVRKASQQALWQYHLNGYRSAGITAPTQTAEPPLAKPKKAPVIAVPTSTTKPVAVQMGQGGVYQQTVEPPLAKPKAEVIPPTPTLTVPPLPPAPTVPSNPPPSVPPPKP